MGGLESAAKLYAGAHDLKDPLVSPVYGDFNDFPPTFLVSGTRRPVSQQRRQNTHETKGSWRQADLNIIEGFSHADHLFLASTPESKLIYRALGNFLLQYLK